MNARSLNSICGSLNTFLNFFVLVFNILNAVFRLAEEAGVFAPLGNYSIRHRLSFFADDVVLLVKPSVEQAKAAVDLLHIFGNASGFHCNLANSSVSPIRHNKVDMQPILDVLGCL